MWWLEEGVEVVEEEGGTSGALVADDEASLLSKSFKELVKARTAFR